MSNTDHLRELIAAATVDCYGEEEQFWGMLTALGEALDFPLAATLIGENVELIDIDDGASTSSRGIAAQIRYKGREYSVSLADLQIIDADSDGAEWLAAYRHWLR
jgi:hypothetical protein